MPAVLYSVLTIGGDRIRRGFANLQGRAEV
jgi:hypothetical protein